MALARFGRKARRSQKSELKGASKSMVDVYDRKRASDLASTKRKVRPIVVKAS